MVYLISFLSLIFTLVIFHMIGRLSLQIIKADQTNKYLNEFLSTLFGVIICVSINAILKTSGNTIFVLIISSFTLLLILLKNKSQVIFEISFQKLINVSFIKRIVIFSIIVFVFQLISHINFSDGNLIIPLDVNFYANISYYLQYGFENVFIGLNELLDDNLLKAVPYHFVDSWLNNLINNIFTIGHTKSFILITYPLLIVLFLLGISSITSKFFKSEKTIILLSLTAIIFSPAVFNLTKTIFAELVYSENGPLNFNVTSLENTGFFYNTNIFSYYGQKHLINYILIILVFNLSLFFRNKKASILSFSILPLIHIGFFPSVFGGLGLYSIIYLTKTKSLKKLFKNFTPALLVASLIIVFYFIINKKPITNDFSNSLIYLGDENLNFKGEIIRGFIKIIYPLLFSLIIYLPLIILMLFKRIRIKLNEEINILTAFHSIILTAFILTIFFQGFDSVQFLTTILPLVNILFFITTIIAIKHLVKCKLFVLVFTFSCLASSFIFFTIQTRINWNISDGENYEQNLENKSYDINYQKEVFSKIGIDKETPIGFILDKEIFSTYKRGYWYKILPNRFLLDNDFFRYFSLTNPKICGDSINPDLSNHQYYINKYSNSNNNIINTIKNKKIRHISCSANAIISDEIQKRITYKLVDNKTGEMFLIIK